MGCVKCKMRKTKSAVRNGETRGQGVKSYPCGSAPVWKTLAEVLGLCQSERSQLRAAVMRRSDGASQRRPDRRASPALTTSRVEVAVTFMVPGAIPTHYETFGYFTKFAKNLYSDGNDRKES